MRTLDFTQKQNVVYCIPNWLRDEQIKQSIARGLPSLKPFFGERDEPVAIACFGPSLRQTWEQLRQFKHVISNSGAHRFLIDRGIVPTWHVAVDPLPKNTVALIGEPHPDVEYLISSTCHADVYDHLQGRTVKLWHVFDATEDGQRLLPYGDWALTGGCDVGLRSLTIAAFLGFRHLHVFGMDQSAGTVEQPTEARHAAAHPNGPQKYDQCTYDGMTYLTTPAMLEACRQAGHEMDQLPGVTATFYGEGLCQHVMRTRTPTTQAPRDFLGAIAASRPQVISAEYVALNARLHRENLAYGVGGDKHADTVKKLCEALKTTSVLDYGCGKGYLARALPFPIWEYDPAIPSKAESPRPADLVVCTDVLEHVEPDHLDAVLADLSRCVKQVGYFVIHTGPATKTLADGRNAHLIQRDAQWWRTRIQTRFQIGKQFDQPPLVTFVVGPKQTKKAKLNAAVQASTPPSPRPPQDMTVVAGIQVMA